MALCTFCAGSGMGTVVNSSALPEYGGVCHHCGGSGTIPDEVSYTPRYKSSNDSERIQVTSNNEPKDYYLLFAAGLAFVPAYYIGKLIYHIGLNYMTKENEAIIYLTVMVTSIAAFSGVLIILQREKIRKVLEPLFIVLFILFVLYGLYWVYLR